MQADAGLRADRHAHYVTLQDPAASPRPNAATEQEVLPDMTIVINAHELPAADRAEAIRHTIWSTVVRVEIEHHPEPSQIAAVGKISDFGPVNVCSIRSNATTVRRTPKLARDDSTPSLFLGLQVSGSSMVIQGDRQAVLRPGDIAFYDTTRPYTLLNDDGICQHFFRIPHAYLALPPGAIAQITAQRLSPCNSIVDLAGTYFGRLATSPLIGSNAGREAIAQPSIELARAVIATHLADERLARDPLDATLSLRIMEYVRVHLREHDLNAARIAHAHNISVRHLYAVLARADIALGDWIRAHRLEECRMELAKPTAMSMTVSAVARRWGFIDPTHFGRAFKQSYGMSPREWRNLKNLSTPSRDLCTHSRSDRDLPS